MPRPANKFRACVLAAGCAAGAAAHALSSDRSQQLFIDANHQRSTQSPGGNPNEPNVTHLDGNVVMTQGSMKAHGDHAVIYQNPSHVVDANGNAGSLTRVVLTGRPAHMEQLHDGDCARMSADAETIDYRNDTGIAVLTGQVVVTQQGKGEFRGEHMIYNTNTGELESGDDSPASRVHLVVEPKAAAPAAPPRGENCGYPTGPARPKPGKPADGAGAH
jgi:lipopolysaccharide export system protein LptA